MKAILLMVALFVTTMPNQVNGATRPAVSLDCGNATLWLGMPKQRADDALVRAGYKDVNDYRGISSFWDEVTKQSCDVAFTYKRLSYASREWTDTDDGIEGVFDSVIGAFNSMTEGKLRASCKVFPWHLAAPRGPTDSIDVTCGQKSVSIEKNHIVFPKGVGYDVEEYIGVVPSPSPQ